MRLRAEQLKANLQRSGLAPIYYISGDEPLQLMETADEIRRSARDQGFSERVVLDASVGFEWGSFLQESANLSLFSSKRLIELRLGNTKPGNEGGKALIEYAETKSTDDLLIITSSKIDKKTQQTRWFKALDKVGITIQIWPIELSQLPGWICQRIKQYNKQISLPAATLIAERVEGNLLAASQEIDKLCLLIEEKEIDIDDVLAAVSDSTRYDVFTLIESAFAGNSKRIVHMLNGLRSEGVDPAAVYGALLWEYRRLCSMAYLLDTNTPLDSLFSKFRIWDNKRKQAVKSVLHRHKLKDIHKFLRKVIYIDRQIKGSDRPMVWDSLQQFLLAVAGSPIRQNN
jgi:DNA polymerase-3 subunit delta